MAPLLILDASGHVRKTYLWWEQRRGNLVRLKKARKDYSNLSVHLWDQGGGKSAFNGPKSPRILQGIAKTIDERPDEEWLIVCHILPKMNVEDELRDLVDAPPENLHFITWGRHQATNDYVDVPNVILAGTWFYPLSAYDAIGRASADFSPDEGPLKPKHEKIMLFSEMCHQILQAVCRGAVRKAEGDQCGRCNTYIVASFRTPIKEAVRHAFPEAKIKKWLPLFPVLTGKVKGAADFIAERLRDNMTAVVRYNEIREHLGGMTAANFNKNIRKHPDFEQFLTDNDFAEYTAPDKKQARAFANAGFAYFGEPVEGGWEPEPRQLAKGSRTS